MLDPGEVFKAIFLKPFGLKVDEHVERIAFLRLSETVASFFAGASLAVAGLLMQTVTRNPLSDPYILGLSSTALTAVALATLISPSLMVLKESNILVAFVGALLGYFLTISLAKLAGGSPLALVLAGIAVSSLFSGVSHVLLYMAQNILKIQYYYPLMGTAHLVKWEEIMPKTCLNIEGFGTVCFSYPGPLVTAPIIATIASLALFKPFNAFLYGDEYSKQLGFNPKITMFVASAIASILTAVVVAYIGIVGFIGLAAPHIARFLVGSDHRFSIPIAFLVGASLTVFSDIATRVISMSVPALGRLPLGVVTSVIGAPFLAYLVVKRVRE